MILRYLCSKRKLRLLQFLMVKFSENQLNAIFILAYFTSNSSLFTHRQRIIEEAEEEFIFPLVKKRGAIT